MEFSAVSSSSLCGLHDIIVLEVGWLVMFVKISRNAQAGSAIFIVHTVYAVVLRGSHISRLEFDVKFKYLLTNIPARMASVCWRPHLFRRGGTPGEAGDDGSDRAHASSLCCQECDCFCAIVGF